MLLLRLVIVWLLFLQLALALTPPGWPDLEARFVPEASPPLCVDLSQQQEENVSLDPAVPVLFRERHGWCVFSARVWLALEVKGVHYHTYLVESQGDTYDGADAEDISYQRPILLEGLSLPQVKLPGSNNLHGAETEEDLMALLQLIDETFTEGNIKLFPSEDVWKAARAFQNCLPKARESRRAAWLFCAEEGYRLDALPTQVFEGVLDQAEELLTNSDGPFFCGSSVTAADIVWTPILERYAAQLPCLHEGLCPRVSDDRWPNLQDWYDAMDRVPAYVCRVKGDAPSWLKVLYTDPWWPREDLWHPRDSVGPKGELKATEEDCINAFSGEAMSIEDADSLWSQYAATRPYVASKSTSHEAANSLIRNRNAILKDSTQWLHEEGYDTISEESMDATLRQLVMTLSTDSTAPSQNTQHLAYLLTYLDARMCVPRDMGNLPATCLRRLLRTVSVEMGQQSG